MPEPISGNQALFKVAEELGELRGFRISGVTSNVALTLALPTSAEANAYQWARAKIALRGWSQVSSHNSAGAFVFNSGFITPVVGEVIGLTLWNANKEQAVKDIVQRLIYHSYPLWFREQRMDLNSSLLVSGATYTLSTLDAAVDEYALPADLVYLSRIGIQDAITDPWRVPFPPRDLWRTFGDEGVKRIKFFNNGRLYLPSAYAGKKLCLWYMAREPVLTDWVTPTCRLPEDYFSTAAAALARQGLWNSDRSELATANVALPSLQIEAANALNRLALIRDGLPRGPEYGYNLL